MTIRDAQYPCLLQSRGERLRVAMANLHEDTRADEYIAQRSSTFPSIWPILKIKRSFARFYAFDSCNPPGIRAVMQDRSIDRSIGTTTEM